MTAPKLETSEVLRKLKLSYDGVYRNQITKAIHCALCKSNYSSIKFSISNIWLEKALYIVFLHAIETEDVGLAALASAQCSVPDMIQYVKVLPLGYCCSQYSISDLSKKAEKLERSRLLPNVDRVLKVLVNLPKKKTPPTKTSRLEMPIDEVASLPVTTSAVKTLEESLMSRLEAGLRYLTRFSKFSLSFTLHGLGVPSKGLFLTFLYGLISKDPSICDPLLKLFPASLNSDGDVLPEELVETIFYDYKFSANDLMAARDFYNLYKGSSFVNIPEQLHRSISSFFKLYFDSPLKNEDALNDNLRSNSRHSSLEPSTSPLREAETSSQDSGTGCCSQPRKKVVLDISDFEAGSLHMISDDENQLKVTDEVRNKLTEESPMK